MHRLLLILAFTFIGCSLRAETTVLCRVLDKPSGQSLKFNVTFFRGAESAATASNPTALYARYIDSVQAVHTYEIKGEVMPANLPKPPKITHDDFKTEFKKTLDLIGVNVLDPNDKATFTLKNEVLQWIDPSLRPPVAPGQL